MPRRAFSWRSIPACAGEPSVPGEIGKRIEVYPRVCGGTPHKHPATFPYMGLSPRVRGNLISCPQWVPPTGSIPACAGEP